MAAKPILLAVTSDQHTGSTLGLCPSKGVRLDDDGVYMPSKAQVWLWDNWVDYWHKVAALRRQLGATLYNVYVGDATDSSGPAHHGSTQTISSNPEVQAYVTAKVFQVPRDLQPAKSWMVRGTEAHVGPSGATEESLAKHLGCEQDPVTQAYSTWHLRLGPFYGRTIEATHHASAGTLPYTRPGAVAKLAFLHRWHRHERGEAPADIILHAHLHVHADSYDTHKTRAIILPAWQLATAHVHKVAPPTYAGMADVGGIVIVVYPDGRYEVVKHLYRPALPPMRAP